MMETLGNTITPLEFFKCTLEGIDGSQSKEAFI